MPPIAAPSSKDGAKTPPDPPLPIVIAVATSFATSSRARPPIAAFPWSVSVMLP